MSLHGAAQGEVRVRAADDCSQRASPVVRARLGRARGQVLSCKNRVLRVDGFKETPQLSARAPCPLERLGGSRGASHHDLAAIVKQQKLPRGAQSTTASCRRCGREPRRATAPCPLREPPPPYGIMGIFGKSSSSPVKCVPPGTKAQLLSEAEVEMAVQLQQQAGYNIVFDDHKRQACGGFFRVLEHDTTDNTLDGGVERIARARASRWLRGPRAGRGGAAAANRRPLRHRSGPRDGDLAPRDAIWPRDAIRPRQRAGSSSTPRARTAPGSGSRGARASSRRSPPSTRAGRRRPRKKPSPRPSGRLFVLACVPWPWRGRRQRSDAAKIIFDELRLFESRGIRARKGTRHVRGRLVVRRRRAEQAVARAEQRGRRHQAV